MKKLSILFLLIINVSALLHGSLTLLPSFDDDIYHFMGYPTSSKDTLGLSYGVSNYNGYPSDHSQSSFLYFDLSGISLTSNEIFAANLNLFVEPIDPNSPYASFRSGNVLIFEQGNFIETSTFSISDLSMGPDIGSFSVVEEGIKILINVTNTLKSWLNFERPNYGFLLMADSQSNIGTQFASMESLIAENRPSLELITNDDLELQLQMISSTSKRFFPCAVNMMFVPCSCISSSWQRTPNAEGCDHPSMDSSSESCAMYPNGCSSIVQSSSICLYRGSKTRSCSRTVGKIPDGKMNNGTV